MERESAKSSSSSSFSPMKKEEGRRKEKTWRRRHFDLISFYFGFETAKDELSHSTWSVSDLVVPINHLYAPPLFSLFLSLFSFLFWPNSSNLVIKQKYQHRRKMSTWGKSITLSRHSHKKLVGIFCFNDFICCRQMHNNILCAL